MLCVLSKRKTFSNISLILSDKQEAEKNFSNKSLVPFFVSNDVAYFFPLMPDNQSRECIYTDINARYVHQI